MRETITSICNKQPMLNTGSVTVAVILIHNKSNFTLIETYICSFSVHFNYSILRNIFINSLHKIFKSDLPLKLQNTAINLISSKVRIIFSFWKVKKIKINGEIASDKLMRWNDTKVQGKNEIVS